ncbi:LacI family DNA-binding transcriptional regulator [Halobacillus litoralis]|uniref:LacI family DNA-binding transcriptional regulator n=1 Tax=Halobacillus litoralis TaxID=45668 RepID=A0A845E4Q0_9BACI|nr:LacI family DNA-binding transcriptional regulator [Halobacillus litoralis]MYL50757.1 LacI family DNA-binding transcriptional regulator [Halobacillus litoralis]
MATIKDIAKLAGVSVTTVSRALNGYSDVNADTRKRIEQIAKEIEYSPNALARSLVMKHTKTIGLLVSGLSRDGAKDNIVFDVLTGINEYCGSMGYDLVLFNTTTSKQKEKTYAQLCRERRVDGVIVQGIKKDDPYLIEIFDSNIPCVLIDVPVENEHTGYVSTDNVDGSMKAIRHLAELGHINIAMINGHDQAYVSKERRKGFELGMVEEGLDIHSEWIVNGEFTELKAEEVAYHLLVDSPEITAIFCASDLMALGVMRAAFELGKRVPDDLSIVGYDDITLASYVTPALTTIAQDTFRMGYEAADLLLKILHQTDEKRVQLIDNELKVRKTTKRCK